LRIKMRDGASEAKDDPRGKKTGLPRGEPGRFSARWPRKWGLFVSSDFLGGKMTRGVHGRGLGKGWGLLVVRRSKATVGDKHLGRQIWKVTIGRMDHGWGENAHDCRLDQSPSITNQHPKVPGKSE